MNATLNRPAGLLLTGFALASLTTFAAAPVALVRGEFTERDLPSEARGVAEFHQVVKQALAGGSVPFDELKDSDVVAGRLAGFRVALFPYPASVPPAELAQVLKFLDGGGKVIWFYTLPVELRARLGVKFLGHQRAEPEGRFSAMKFQSGLVAGVPGRVAQSSWNINLVEPATPQTRVLAEWLDSAGRPTGAPAWVLAPCGAWMSHVLLAGDSANKQHLLQALTGHFAPEVWEQSARTALDRVGQGVGFNTLDELAAAIETAPTDSRQKRAARQALKDAQSARRRAERLLAARQFREALDAAHAAQGKAREAFFRLQPSKAGEFRAVWIHSGSGIESWGWDRTVRVLKENGFNAILPNLLWAGVAHYPSKLLPTSETAKAKGDQLADCLRACRRHGVELHVWKVNHNLAHAPPDFVKQLRAAGRTQKHKSGEDIDWLCPSHPDNFALERDSMLEIVRTYKVDGIHFDYIRYPHSNACFCQGCRTRFEQAAGVKLTNWPADVLNGALARPFGDWRRAQITRLVQAVSEEAHRLRPKIKVSAAVFGDWDSCRHQVGQDWKAWVDAGLLDFVCPMDYDPRDANFAALVRHQVGWVNRKTPLYIGIGAYRLASPEHLIRQIQITRDLGAEGFVLFQHDAQLATEFLPALRLGAAALPPR